MTITQWWQMHNGDNDKDNDTHTMTVTTTLTQWQWQRKRQLQSHNDDNDKVNDNHTMTNTMACLIISLNSSDDLSPLAAFVSICFCRLSLSAWPRNQKLYKYWWDWYFWKNVESLSKEQTWNVFQTCLSWISLASLSLRSPHSLSNLSLSSAVSRALQAVRNLNFWPELCYRLRKCADAIYLHFILYLLLPSPFRCFLVQTTSQIVIVCQEQEEDLMSWLLTLFAETVLFFLYPSKTSWIFCEVSTIFFLVSSLLENASVIFTAEKFEERVLQSVIITTFLWFDDL